MKKTRHSLLDAARRHSPASKLKARLTPVFLRKPPERIAPGPDFPITLDNVDPLIYGYQILEANGTADARWAVALRAIINQGGAPQIVQPTQVDQDALLVVIDNVSAPTALDSFLTDTSAPFNA